MSLSTNKKLKILLVGPVENKVDILKTKLQSLQKSKAGPFDVCFCVGNFGSTTAEMPLPVYVQEYTGEINKEKNADAATKDGADADDTNTAKVDGDAKDENDDSAKVENDTSQSITKLSTNLFYLGNNARQADVYSIGIDKHTLVVASCPSSRVRLDSEETQPLQQKLGHVSYVGCDLTLTSEWPQGIDKVLPDSNSTAAATAACSFDVAELALRARPRYHVSCGAQFVQSLPFQHLQSSTSTVPIPHSGRFLALAPVVTPQEMKSKGKLGKFVHALGLQPLQESALEDLQSTAKHIQPCPFTDASYEKDAAAATPSETNVNVGFSEAHARRIMAEQAGTTNAHSRWTAKRKRDFPTTDDPNNSTLFINGLHKDVSGKLQTGSVALLQAFAKYGIEQVRRPPSATSYAFLEFDSHDQAKACLEDLGGEVTIEGIHLTVKWAWHASSSSKDARHGAPPKKRRMTEAEAHDSSTIYFKMPPKVLSAELEAATEDLRRLMEATLEAALAQDGAEETVSAETEPALRVKARRPAAEQNFGFLEFASHAAASMALATLTKNTDGGIVTLTEKDEDVERLLHRKSHLMGVALHWAHDAVAPADEKRKHHGLSFQRRHFPPDARTDCWFCLASPTCERHLVVSVHEECYVATPKGPAAEGHVLVIPVAHTSRGALVDNAQLAAEMQHLQSKLQQHASEVLEKDLFVFERAIQTKGGYHTHVQCIPVERGLGPKLQATLLGMAKSIPGFELKEINSDLALSALMTGDDEEGDDGGYFYAEIQVSPLVRKRFLYKATNGKSHVVPLQFGREVIATVLKNPDLAHWKACVVDEEKETAMTLAFRKTFEKYTE